MRYPLRSFLLFTLIHAAGCFAQQYELIRDLAVANGPIEAMAQSGDTLFIAGSFTQVGHPISNAAFISTVDGVVDRTALMPNSAARACISDGQGGWFVSGIFNNYGGSSRPGIARLNADRSLSPWRPPSGVYNAQSTAMVLAGNWLFTANDAAVTAFDAATGVNIGWSLYVDNDVRAMDVQNGILYIGGDFSSCASQPRSHVAAIDISSGTLTDWNVSCNGNVYGLKATADAIFIGGDFNTVSGSFRDRLAAVDPVTTLCTSWNPGMNGGVRTMVTRGDTAFIGGGFSMVGDSSRMNLAAVSLSTGSVLDWAPRVDGNVFTIDLDGNSLYIGGYFTQINEEPRQNIGAVDVLTGLPTTWSSPGIRVPIYCLSVNSGWVLASGASEFSMIQPETRPGLAAISLSTGMLLPWQHELAGQNASVQVLSVIRGNLYIGGTFSSVDGQERKNICSIHLASDQLTAWNPQPSNTVRAVAFHGDRLYVGGSFSTISGQTRPSFASFEGDALTLSAWNPVMNYSPVNAFAFHDNVVFVARSGATIAIDTLTGVLVPGYALPNIGTVYSMCMQGDILYMAGNFFSVNSTPRNGAAACNTVTGELTDWDPDLGYEGTGIGNVKELGSNASGVYLGGASILFGFYSWGSLVPVDGTIGIPDSTELRGLTSDVRAMLVSDTMIIVGGDFPSFWGEPRNRLAAFRITNDITTVAPSTAHQVRSDLRVWPNPYADGPLHFVVDATNGGRPERADLFDAEGRLVGALHCHTSENIGASAVRGELSGEATRGLHPGSYMVRMTFQDGFRYGRLIVLP